MKPHSCIFCVGNRGSYRKSIVAQNSPGVLGGGVQYYEQHFCPYVVDELLGETLTEVGSKVVKIALD